MKNKEAYIDKFDAKIEELQADIDKLDAKARQSEADMRIKYQDELEQLKAQRDLAKSRLDEIKNSSDDAWEELKAGTEKAFDELKSSWNAAKSKFSKE